MDRRLRSLKKLAKKYDRTIEFTGADHIRLVCNKGVRPHVPSSASPKNVDLWLKEVERDLRRAEPDGPWTKGPVTR